MFRKNEYDVLNEMLDAAIAGRFEESDYNESELSKLQAKWKRYLTLSKQSSMRVEEDRAKLRALVTDISHQTKTPLSNILLYAQLLSEQELSEEGEKLTGEIMDYAEKLSFLIQSLVKISRLETGTFQLTPVETDLSGLMEEMVREMLPAAKAKNMTLDIRGERMHTPVLCDPKWTKEAIVNVLDNAVKYAPENTTIAVCIRRYELFSCVEVADAGPGITEEEIPLIFARFYRGKGVRDKAGTGVGLYLSREIIEGQGGYIKVRSKKGEGSRFQIFLQNC